MVMGKDEIGQHTVQQYNEDLENLHRSVLGMGQLVLAQLDEGIAALACGDKERATRVVRRDVDVNTLEVHLDKECQRILVRRQPAAGDLRLIFAVIKTVTDLERIGDQVGHVARAVLESDLSSPNRPHAALAHSILALHHQPGAIQRLQAADLRLGEGHTARRRPVVAVVDDDGHAVLVLGGRRPSGRRHQ